MAKIAECGSVRGIGERGLWTEIAPNSHHDWVKQRNSDFAEFLTLGDKKGDGHAIFDTFSLGVVTNRDPWCYNFSSRVLEENLHRTISFYHEQKAHLQKSIAKKPQAKVEEVITTDLKRISWTRSLKNQLVRGKDLAFERDKIVTGMYRPFCKQRFYFDPQLNEMVYLMPKLFPRHRENRVMSVIGVVERKGFSVLMTDAVPNLHLLDTGQCFPLYFYEEVTETKAQLGLLTSSLPCKEAISDWALVEFRKVYGKKSPGKEDIFYYIYGLLHSIEYREKYQDSLARELPRIPLVPQVEDFWAFSTAGRHLAELHVGYESVQPYQVSYAIGREPKRNFGPADYRVEKMKFGGEGKSKEKSTVVYNHRITMTGIPLEAYEYVVNAKSALEWVMDRQCVSTDKASGIVNDANRYAVEVMKDPAYPLKLFQRIVTVSLETMKIVKALPKLEI